MVSVLIWKPIIGMMLIHFTLFSLNTGCSFNCAFEHCSCSGSFITKEPACICQEFSLLLPCISPYFTSENNLKVL